MHVYTVIEFLYNSYSQSKGRFYIHKTYHKHLYTCIRKAWFTDKVHVYLITLIALNLICTKFTIMIPWDYMPNTGQ